jgi:hypothetical protein
MIESFALLKNEPHGDRPTTSGEPNLIFVERQQTQMPFRDLVSLPIGRLESGRKVGNLIAGEFRT